MRTEQITYATDTKTHVIFWKMEISSAPRLVVPHVTPTVLNRAGDIEE